MNKNCVLVVEDDEPKQRSIVSLLKELLSENVDVLTAESLASAVAVLSHTQIAFAIVDMSIPTFDFVKDRRGGGQPQGFGGADILRFLDSETTVTKSVVLTQYEEFIHPEDGRRHDPRSLEDMLRNELDERFLGVIYYDGQHGAWRRSLYEALESVNLLGTK